MKKYLSLILVAIVLVMALALVSCKNEEEPPAPAPDNGVHVHTPGEWVLVKAPTCVDHGEQIQFCTSCKALLHKMPVYDAWNHVEVVTIEREEPTCLEVGYTAETRCSVCDTVVSQRTEIPALGHTPGEWEVVVEPTCEDKGTNVKKCTVCKAEVEFDYEITALGHAYNTWVWIEDGIERLDCGVCGHEGTEKIFSKGLAYRLDGESYHVSGVDSCADLDIVLPHVYNGKPVTAIDQEAFAMCRSIKSVYIPNTVNYIRIGAFKYCEAMETVTFEENSQLQTIAQRAFDNCSALKSITIPASVTKIEKEAFVKSGLISVTFENPDGWCYANNALVSTGTSISADDLSDAEVAAKYLVTDYVGKWWRNK